MTTIESYRTIKLIARDNIARETAMTSGRTAASMTILHDRAISLLESGFDPDSTRFRVYKLRDFLGLNLRDIEVESALWMAIERTVGIL
ncbi:MAG: hypothetical protein O7H41_01440 [Planctomycetota bacterium]|nr:hypothetical protein [Planctomycetota bacterium]